MTDNKIRFCVRSSSSNEIYKLEVRTAPLFKFSCNCQAGQVGLICKHRTSLLLGEVSSVVDLVVGDVEALMRLAAGSPLMQVMTELHSLENEIENLKREITNRKKQMARIMNGI